MNLPGVSGLQNAEFRLKISLGKINQNSVIVKPVFASPSLNSLSRALAEERHWKEKNGSSFPEIKLNCLLFGDRGNNI